MRLFLYHLRLGALSLRRDPVISAIMLAALALGGGIASVAVSQYIRFQGYEIRLAPTLFQVEVLRPRDHNAVFADSAATNPYLEPTAILTRTQHSHPEHRRLVGSGVPARRSSGIRSEVVVRGPGGPARLRVARFTDVDFFTLFQRGFAAGAPWDRALDRATAADDVGPAGAPSSPVGSVVLGRATGQALFPRGGAVGQTIFVEGRSFRVAGVLDRYQPLNAPWMLLMFGGAEDALFLPLPEFDRLRAWPDQPLYRSPVAPVVDAPGADARAALLASDALFVNEWVELPTAAAEVDYRRDLDRLLGPGRYVLRSLAAWRQQFPMPRSQVAFFGFLGFVVLVGSGFNLARWLLTKGLSRSGELGVYRALGAPRSSLFWRTMAEATLLALPAALLAPVAAMPIIWLFNNRVRVVDMPLEVGVLAVVVSMAASFIAGALGALYPAWRLSRIPATLVRGGP